jgi:hypothetical protein
MMPNCDRQLLFQVSTNNALYDSRIKISECSDVQLGVVPGCIGETVFLAGAGAEVETRLRPD